MNPKTFWTERIKEYGHMGDSIPEVFAYDQPLRMEWVRRSFPRADLPLGKESRVLDFACGTGDVVEILSRQNEFKIVAVDFVEDAAKKVKQKFQDLPSVQSAVMDVANLAFSSTVFDAVTGVVGLMSILDEAQFNQAVKEIVRVVKPGGFILVADLLTQSAPKKNKIAIRLYQDYLGTFQSQGCRLITGFSLPRVGAHLYWRCVNRWSNDQLKRFLAAILFGLTRLIDKYLCFPLNSPSFDLKIILFKKNEADEKSTLPT